MNRHQNMLWGSVIVGLVFSAVFALASALSSLSHAGEPWTMDFSDAHCQEFSQIVGPNYASFIPDGKKLTDFTVRIVPVPRDRILGSPNRIQGKPAVYLYSTEPEVILGQSSWPKFFGILPGKSLIRIYRDKPNPNDIIAVVRVTDSTITVYQLI